MRPLYIIAREINASINDQMTARRKPHAPLPSWVHYSRPYLGAMAHLTDARDNYGYDTGYSVVAYFLSNAVGWRGPYAKALRAELKDHLNAARTARAGS